MNNQKPEFIKHYSEIQQSEDTTYYPGSGESHSLGSAFGKAFGLKKLGIHHEVLPPGKRTSWPHAESAEEEFVYVIEGNPHVWIDGNLYPLVPGDGVGFPSGTGISHTFINNTESEVRLLVVGETSKKENLIYYPLHPVRRDACKDFWWNDIRTPQLGPHDGLPDKLRESAPLGPLNYTGEIIVESLKDQQVLMKLESFKINSRIIEAPSHKVSQWTVNRYCLDQGTLDQVCPELEKQLDVGEWYIHFFSDLGNSLIVIFRGKQFIVSKKRDSSWDLMTQCGESNGVPRKWTESISTNLINKQF